MRHALRSLGPGLIGVALLGSVSAAGAATPVEQWGMFELALKGPAKGNPYSDVRFSARFYQDRGTIEVLGFYDGAGTYRVRFMPPAPGVWHYTTVSSATELEALSGDFTVRAPGPHNHGPLKATGTLTFAYADGTKYEGTACDPALSPRSARDAGGQKAPAASPTTRVCFDVPAGFSPSSFRRLERRLASLERVGVEADLVLLPSGADSHRPSSDTAPAQSDARYLEYVVARLAAFRNVWWSVATDRHATGTKTDAASDRLRQLVATADPYHHMLSVVARSGAGENDCHCRR